MHACFGSVSSLDHLRIPAVCLCFGFIACSTCCLTIKRLQLTQRLSYGSVPSVSVQVHCAALPLKHTLTTQRGLIVHVVADDFNCLSRTHLTLSTQCVFSTTMPDACHTPISGCPDNGS